MKQHNLAPDAQMRLLEEIYGEKAIVSAVERNRENREIEIQNALRRLSEQQREMILYQYGFADGLPHTAEETAQHFDLSREDAERITSLALRTLRSPACSGGLRVLLSQL